MLSNSAAIALRQRWFFIDTDTTA